MAHNAHRLKALLSGLKPFQLLTLGFLSYVLAGTALLALPLCQQKPTGLLDNLFNVVSAVSTTGLSTVSVADSYTFLGELVLLVLFQLGGIGYMTLTSFILLSRDQPLSPVREGILKSEFALPAGLSIRHFVVQVVWFTLIIETLGALLLWRHFELLDVPHPLWSGIFHSISAFATAGFSLYNNSLEDFAGHPMINTVIGGLCYLGALGFIVLQDVWLSARLVERRLTLTSKIILVFTGVIFLVGTPLLYLSEPALRALPVFKGIMAAAFQVMTASTTAGFNTVPIGGLSAAGLLLIIVAMLIGASPSGTGGGIKTTTVSALYAVLASQLRGLATVRFWGRRVPATRLRTAVANATLYLSILVVGVFALCLVQSQGFLQLAFEAASALGTVGLSMGITGDLTTTGKWVVIALMFIGRVGPLTLGLSLFHKVTEEPVSAEDDLAV